MEQIETQLKFQKNTLQFELEVKGALFFVQDTRLIFAYKQDVFHNMTGSNYVRLHAKTTFFLKDIVQNYILFIYTLLEVVVKTKDNVFTLLPFTVVEATRSLCIRYRVTLGGNYRT